MDFDTRAAAYAVIVEDERILLSQWVGVDHPVWTLPGGGMELEETPEQSCLREVEEETGMLAELTGLLGVHSFTIPTERRLNGAPRPQLAVQILYTARVLSGTLRPEVGGSSNDAAWHRLEDLERLHQESPERLSPTVLRGLEWAGLPLATVTRPAGGAA